MITIQQLKLPADHSSGDLREAVRRALRLPSGHPFTYEIIRQSIDARKKPDIFYVYTVEADCGKREDAIIRRCRNRQVTRSSRPVYQFPPSGREPLGLPPVIVGCGPAGLFCGLMLARAGYRPILLERGQSVEERQKTVERFWEMGELNPESNVQFGEGGAGTFSDGKLNTMVKDPQGRIRFVLNTFVQAGADPDILYSYKPHVGTDVLAGVVQRIREEIISLGGQVFFDTRLDDLTRQEDGRWRLLISRGGHEGPKEQGGMRQIGRAREESFLEAQAVVLAIGHSARDTFSMLHDRRFAMEAKSFAVGVRVEHPQSLIDDAMYGKNCPVNMPPAPYKVTHKLPDGRGVYSFCMCPGGYVVNASSEPGRLAVNGMSYRNRAGEHANSAIVVTVTPEDFGGSGPLAGLEFQRRLEEKAYQAAEGRIPVQRFEDFCAGIPSVSLGSLTPQMKGAWAPANVRGIFPADIGRDIQEGILSFERQIPGFSHPDTLVSGVESRTSSPVRILRDSQFESNFPGIYPCGEGAGYAGGITSAAMDGMRVAEALASKFSIDFLMK